jgi:hypothetical protein
MEKELSVYFSEVEAPGVEGQCLHLLTDMLRQVLKQRQGKTLIICKETDFIPGVYILQIRKKTQIINRKMIVC